jgi:sporulation protein YlmC with PRC-barrel domain
MEQELYSGWRTSDLLGSRVFSKKGEYLGMVRNIVVADNGQVKALIAEEAGIGITLEFVFRLPWKDVAKPVHRGALIADLSDARSRQYGLFPAPFGKSDEDKPQAEDFLVTKVLGDYARLQTGIGYGLVKDVVFSPQGRMVAVLVARDAAKGGGTIAFPSPGPTGKWSPRASYYGLPFVTAEEADRAGMRVDVRRFESNGSG